MEQRTPDRVIPFSPIQSDDPQEKSDSLDRSGRAVIALLQEAVGVAKQDCQRAVDMAEKLALEWRASQDRIAQLEGEIRRHQDRAARAEKWIQRIHAEVEERFFQAKTNRAARTATGDKRESPESNEN
jgi:hypothetical protein